MRNSDGMLRKGPSADVKTELSGHLVQFNVQPRSNCEQFSYLIPKCSAYIIISGAYLVGAIVVDWLTSDQVDRGRVRTKATMLTDAEKLDET